MEMWVWLGVFVVFVIAEAATAELVSLWFCFGSLAGLAASLLSAPVWAQVLCFVVAGFASLIILRPPLKKRLAPRGAKTNLDRLIGMEATVVEEVSSTTGAVRVDGKEWNARLRGSDTIPVGEQCEVVELVGNKLLVAAAVNNKK